MKKLVIFDLDGTLLDTIADLAESANHALKQLGYPTHDAETIRNADKVLLPGVGEASSAMEKLRERGLCDVIKNLTQPVLGICIGMQLMCKSSEEGGNVKCLGIFDEEVKRFEPNAQFNKVPHMGWNTIAPSGNALFKGLPDDPYFYYVHSYYATVGADTIATTDYIHPYSAALHKDNFYAVQFHPEKSGSTGLKILSNFGELL